MRIRYIVYIAIALIIGFLIYNKLFGGKAKQGQGTEAGGGKGKDGKGAGGRKGGPVPVNIMIVKDTVVNSIIDVTGTIDPNERVNLMSETSGRITGIFFNEGSRVKKGQLLVKVYNQDLQASLKQNEYQVALARENEYRNRILVQKEAISRQEYDTSLSSLNSLKAQSEMIRAQISRTEIRAPFSGTIGLRNVSPGGFMSPGTAIATLVNDNPVKITFSVPERYLPLLKSGSKINFTVETSRDTYTATVYAIEPAIDPNSRSITVRARAANPKGLLTAGSFAKINLTLDQIPKTIMIPTEAVIPDLKSSKVFVFQNDTAVARMVKTDLRTDTRIQIVEGLKPGDSVVVSGIIQMRPKVPLKIVKVIK